MIETMLNRRSVRRFSDRPVEEEKLQLLLRAAMQAPSAKNAQPWEFLVVKDKEVLEALAKAQPYAMAIKNAPLGIVTLCNKARYTDDLDAFWQEDLSAVTQTILLAAAELGLGTTWLALAPLEERIEYVQKLFSLPEAVIPFAMLPVGYPMQQRDAASRFDASRVHDVRGFEVEGAFQR